MRVPRLTIYQIVLEVLCLALLIAGLTFVAIKYPGLPVKIPNHFDAAGNVTDYAGKGSIWLLEGVNLAMYAMMTVFIFIPVVIENPNVTWQVNPAARGLLARDTVSLLGEVKLECVALFDWILVPMTRGTNMSSWPMWIILAVMTAGMILRLVHMKKISAVK
jgi:uncharacterized membrane protein